MQRFKPIHITVHPRFFSKFEEARKQTSRRLNLHRDLTQPQFTEIMSKVNFHFPKIRGATQLKKRGLIINARKKRRYI